LAKLCAKGKAAAKRKFDVYPSAYANMYASAVCSGKVKPGGKKKTVKKGSKDAKRRKSYCARSAGQLRNSSAKTRNDPNSRIRQARRRWKCR